MPSYPRNALPSRSATVAPHVETATKTAAVAAENRVLTSGASAGAATVRAQAIRAHVSMASCASSYRPNATCSGIQLVTCAHLSSVRWRSGSRPADACAVHMATSPRHSATAVDASAASHLVNTFGNHPSASRAKDTAVRTCTATVAAMVHSVGYGSWPTLT